MAFINAGTPLPPLIVCGIHVWAYLDLWGEDCMHVEAVGWCWESLLIALSSYSIKRGLWIKPEPAEELSLGRQLTPRIPCLCSPWIEWQEAHHAHSAFTWFLRIWTPVLRLILWLLSHYEYSQTLIMSYNISNILKNVQGHWLQYKRIQSETVARKKTNHQVLFINSTSFRKIMFCFLLINNILSAKRN